MDFGNQNNTLRLDAHPAGAHMKRAFASKMAYRSRVVLRPSLEGAMLIKHGGRPQ